MTQVYDASCQTDDYYDDSSNTNEFTNNNSNKKKRKESEFQRVKKMTVEELLTFLEKEKNLSVPLIKVISEAEVPGIEFIDENFPGEIFSPEIISKHKIRPLSLRSLARIHFEVLNGRTAPAFLQFESQNQQQSQRESQRESEGEPSSPSSSPTSATSAAAGSGGALGTAGAGDGFLLLRTLLGSYISEEIKDKIFSPSCAPLCSTPAEFWLLTLSDLTSLIGGITRAEAAEIIRLQKLLMIEKWHAVACIPDHVLQICLKAELPNEEEKCVIMDYRSRKTLSSVNLVLSELLQVQPVSEISQETYLNILRRLAGCDKSALEEFSVHWPIFCDKLVQLSHVVTSNTAPLLAATVCNFAIPTCFKKRFAAETEIQPALMRAMRRVTTPFGIHKTCAAVTYITDVPEAARRYRSSDEFYETLLCFMDPSQIKPSAGSLEWTSCLLQNLFEYAPLDLETRKRFGTPTFLGFLSMLSQHEEAEEETVARFKKVDVAFTTPQKKFGEQDGEYEFDSSGSDSD